MSTFLINQLAEQSKLLSEAISSNDFESAKFLAKDVVSLAEKCKVYFDNQANSTERLINSIFRIISTNKNLNDKIKLELISLVNAEVIKLLLDKN